MESTNTTTKKIFWNDCYFGLFPAKYFFPILIFTVLGVATGCNAKGFLGGFVICTVLGTLLEKIGDNLPIVKSYLGGGAFVGLFGAGLVAYLNIFPESSASLVTDFVKTYDYNGLLVGALICGSILSMDRKLLIKAGSRFAIPLCCGIIAAFALTGLVGAITGYGWREAILFVALPIMGGGTAAGAVPTAATYESVLSHDSGYYLSLMMPAVILGNAMAIVCAGFLKGIGKKRPDFTGNGRIFKDPTIVIDSEEKEHVIGLSELGVGFVITGVFYIIGMLLNKIFPMFHYYAWTIIACAAAKICGIFPKDLEESIYQWYKFISRIGIPAILFSIGFVYTDIGSIIENFNLIYVLLVLATIVGAVAGTWIVGGMLGFYKIEIAIAAGLCMANMGGSGDVATLGAADRMDLMPFSQISSRLGGALIIIIASFLPTIIGAGL